MASGDLTMPLYRKRWSMLQGGTFGAGEVTAQDAEVAFILDRVETATRSMIATCRTHNPKVIILLAQVITSSKLPKYSYLPALNLHLAEVAADLHSAAQPVWIVDQAEGWDPVADTVTDQVHPTETGATKMANKWFDALQPLLE